MDEFERIVKLRNEGKTHTEIGRIIGRSKRSVGRYLKSGKVPKYERCTVSNRPDPFEGFEAIAEAKLEEHPSLRLTELYEYLVSKGYAGSMRTVQRKTAELRRRLKRKEVYFKRTVTPGVIMEGDFTEIRLSLGGHEEKIYLWVTTLPYSNAYYVTPFLSCNFECFAEGSINAFEALGGVAEYYRLDNMSPAVIQILKGKDRRVTSKYAEFQRHYDFKQDFCNPGRGNEKGNVESNIRHIKEQLRSRIALNEVEFANLESLRRYLHEFCVQHNRQRKVASRLREEPLAKLPLDRFQPFRTTTAKANKYSVVNVKEVNQSFSVPSQLIGLTLEVRIYPNHIECVDQGIIIAHHQRHFGKKSTTSVKLEHILEALCRKPGSMQDWEHRDILFERPVWHRFYKQLQEQGGTDSDYLSCLRLILEHGQDIVTIAMGLAIEDGMKLNAPSLENLISMKLDKVYSMKPVSIDLNVYNEFLEEVSHGRESSSET